MNAAWGYKARKCTVDKQNGLQPLVLALTSTPKRSLRTEKHFFHDSRQVWLDFGRGNRKYIIKQKIE